MKFHTQSEKKGNERRIVCVYCVFEYLISHLVGPHCHLFHCHVVHFAAVLFGGSPCGTELDILWPGREGRLLSKVTSEGIK